MDEAFWASVVKKWSDASQHALTLQRDLQDVQAESRRYTEQIRTFQVQEQNLLENLAQLGRDCKDYNDFMDEFRPREALPSSDVLPTDPTLSDRNNAMREASASIKRAKIEYRRLLQKLSTLSEQKKAIDIENQDFSRQEHAVAQTHRELSESNNKLCANLSKSRMEIDGLRGQLKDLQSRNQQLEKDLEQEKKNCEDCKCRNSPNTSKSRALRDMPPEAKRIHLTKNEAQPDPKVTDTMNIPQSIPPIQANEQAEERRANKRVNNHTARCVRTSTLTLNPLTLPWVTPIPKTRLHELSELVQYIHDFDDEECRFQRTLLAKVIGGSTQSLITRVVDSQKELSKALDISTYLCPGLEHNPWCPVTPGQHGFMFVGLGRDKDTFLEPHTSLNIFVGLPGQSPRRKEYRYLGVYTVVRVNPLNIEEWAHLSKKVKDTYAFMTKEKKKDGRTVEEIQAAYNTGELLVPCVRLQCVDFDETLYRGLVRAKIALELGSRDAGGKRGRDEGDDGEVQRRRPARKSNPT